MAGNGSRGCHSRHLPRIALLSVADEKIGDEEAAGEAAAEFDPLDLHVDPDEPAPTYEVDYDARLEELKRRMGEDE